MSVVEVGGGVNTRSRVATRSHSTVPDFVSVIAQQCRRHPGKPAVIASDGSLTYRDLANRVATLANRLTALGIAEGSLVALSMPRGADELTAMLAVLTTGAAYLPIDPAQPEARLAMIVADALPDLLVARRGDPLPAAAHAVPTVFVDDDRESATTAVNESWVPRPGEEALAYVLFTSGSTGRPKGVEVTRGAVSNLLASMIRTPGLRESDVLLAVSTTMFDIAVLELFGPLCVGATVRIVDSDVIKDGRRLRAVLDSEHPSVMQATPTLWHLLVDAGWTGDGHLRVLVGGEALSPDLARQLLVRGEVWNMYGPTETTVWSTCKRIERADDITIGRPIDNTTLYVLGERGQPAATGMSGELYIGGAGLARGYRGRPDLTADRFIQNPFGPPGDRLYRTGDLVRLRDNGECEYRGRLDHQVKVRGYRIELGEIEAALADLECVNRAVVTTWSPADGSPMLVAYVIPNSKSEFDPTEASRALRRRLPAYMVPNRYIPMAAFPLTPNNKIDRAQLPNPATSQELPIRSRRLPAAPTATEAAILRIWSEALHLEDIAVDDDFFDIGGQSVVAAKICTGIHRVLRADLPVSALLENRTVEQLGAYVDRLHCGSDSQKWTSVVPIQPGGSRPPIFCVSGISGNPMTFVALAESLGEDQPFYGLQHRGVDGKLPPHSSIESMACEFVDDMRAVQPAGPYIVAGYSAGGLAAYEMARLLTAAGEDVQLLILLDTVRPGLSSWSRAERFRSHWANLRDGGLRYLGYRVSDRAVVMFRKARRNLRAWLAARRPYRYRLEALEVAGIAAQAAYVPQPYDGDVLLFQSTFDVPVECGVAEKRHEANGWRDLVRGEVTVVGVPAHHFDLVAGPSGQFVAAQLGRFLAAMSHHEEVAQ